MRTVAAVLRKDLLLELRTLETVPAMALLAVATFVIFHFGLNRDTLSGQLAAGVFTVTLLFAAMLAVNRLFVAEREQGGFDAFLLAPVDRTALLFAKATALVIFMVVLEVIAVPAFALFANPPRIWHSLPALVAILLLADIAFAVIGTFVARDRGPDPRARPDRPGHRPAAAAAGADRDRSRNRAAADRARRRLTVSEVAAGAGAL